MRVRRTVIATAIAGGLIVAVASVSQTPTVEDHRAPQTRPTASASPTGSATPPSSTGGPAAATGQSSKPTEPTEQDPCALLPIEDTRKITGNNKLQYGTAHLAPEGKTYEGSFWTCNAGSSPNGVSFYAFDTGETVEGAKKTYDRVYRKFPLTPNSSKKRITEPIPGVEAAFAHQQSDGSCTVLFALSHDTVYGIGWKGDCETLVTLSWEAAKTTSQVGK